MKNHKNTSKYIPGDKEKSLMKKIQGDIPLAHRPFLEISNESGLSESDVISTVRDMIKDKVIRRFGAVLRHQKAGFTENAILLASAGGESPEKIGQLLASFREVSHCYQREPQFMGRYGIFAMVHAGQGELEGLVKEIVSHAGIKDYLLLPSVAEFKKTSLEPV